MAADVIGNDMASDRILELIGEEPSDEIWQEAIRVSEFIRTQHDEVFQLTMSALAKTEQVDTITALSTCLLEHLLEHDFSCFDYIESRITNGDNKLLYALSLCAKFGLSARAENSSRWDALIEENRNRLSYVRETYKVD
jgi:hypothetical protein